MKKILRTLSFILVAALCLSLLCSCSPKLKMKNGKLVNSKTGVEYSFVSSVYLPKSISTEVYAVFEYNDVQLDYFSIENVDPELWLISENDDVIYSGDVTKLPGLKAYSPNEMYICYNYDTLYTLVDEKDTDIIDTIVDRFENGDVVSPSLYDYTTYRLIFISDIYTDYYYSLRLRVTEDAMYMCDLSTGAHVEVSDLFGDYSDIAYVEEEYE